MASKAEKAQVAEKNKVKKIEFQAGTSYIYDIDPQKTYHMEYRVFDAPKQYIDNVPILAIADKRIDFAQLYAENAIRKKNESLNYLRLASRLDAVQSRVKTAQSMNQITKQMTGVTAGLDKAMKSMNLEQISQVMDKFEKQFENLDVHSKVMEDSMGSATSMSTPQSQVDALIQQVADENGLEVMAQVDTAPIGEGSLAAQEAAAASSADADLERRLRAMRN